MKNETFVFKFHRIRRTISSAKAKINQNDKMGMDGCYFCVLCELREEKERKKRYRDWGPTPTPTRKQLRLTKSQAKTSQRPPSKDRIV